MSVPTTGSIRLAMMGLPRIDSLDDLSATTHLSKGLIYRLCRFSDHFYKTCEIPKKSGGSREIAQPSKEMKALQGWILRNILDPLCVSPAAKGFEKGTSVRDNAFPHRGCSAILCLDLEDFFPSIKVNQVWSVFRTVGYSPRMSAALASICCYNRCLPQGAPTSPKLANLVTLRLDLRMLGFVGRRGIAYTRYADDLTFSSLSARKLQACFSVIQKIVESEGFRINGKKTRCAGPGRRHRITGLVVTGDGVGIGRTSYRLLRARIFNLCKKRSGTVSSEDLARVEGWVAFVNGVDKPRHRMITTYIARLKYTREGTAISDLRVANQRTLMDS